jgi:signal transduction histidine kinase
MAVPLNTEYGRYTLSIYPSQDTQDSYLSNEPMVYTIVVVFALLFTSIVFGCFVLVVERRQRLVMRTALENAHKAAAMERELNLFLAHEVRNPLSSAISACTFATDTCQLLKCHGDPEQEECKQALQDDCKVIQSSLQFIDEFLRNMLDTHRAAAIQLNLSLLLQIC